MSLAATLSSGGMRPASFLPAIKCSNCGDEIEIAAMGDHICGPTPASQPEQQPATQSNPFTLRQMNAHGHMPHAPSPLQQQSQPPKATPAPQTRVRAPTVTSKVPPVPKLPRTAPPRINPDAANRPFLAPMPPGSDSPISPALSARSGSSDGSRPPPPTRSATSPMPRMFDPRPPSPEMTGSFDCAFPPFPAPSSVGSDSRPGTAGGGKTPTPSERAVSRGSSRQGSNAGGAERPPWMAGPRSPAGSDNGMGRANTLKSGPTSSGRQPSDQGSVPPPMDRRRPSLSSIKFGNEPPPIPNEPIPRPSTSHAMRSQTPRQLTAGGSNLMANSEMSATIRSGQPSRPERPDEDLMSPKFLDELSDEPVVEMPSIFSPSQPPVPVRSAERSRTFPVDREDEHDLAQFHDLHKAPSEPELRSRERRPTLTAGSVSDLSHLPQTAYHQRTSSRGNMRIDPRLQDAPPVPRPVLQHRKERTHSPSGSGSSTASSTPSLGDSTSSSGPSPVDSAASSLEVSSLLNHGTKRYGEEEGMRVAGLNFKVRQDPGMRAEQPAYRSSPPKNFARPSAPRTVDAPLKSPTLPSAEPTPLESPMDPALAQRDPGRNAFEPWQAPAAPQDRLALPTRSNTGPAPSIAAGEVAQAQQMPPSSTSSSNSDYDPFRAPSPQPHTRARSKSNAAPPRSPTFNMNNAPAMPLPTLPSSQYKSSNPGTTARTRSPQPAAVPAPPPIPQDPVRPQPLTRRSTNAVRAVCRGCNKTIEGKSVKAADGRLTGRWHKSCFVCRCCEQPFLTADFYVIDNQPYCEQHYHEKNGSLCHGCHRGIEGQYLETSSSAGTNAGNGSGKVDKKFHPRCFTCCDCRQVLSEDYFEISGRVFCERHALAAMRGQARMMAGPGLGVGGGMPSSNLNPQDKKALTAERRTTKLMMM
ncbi:hypothetical protein LTR78_007690 [Recurvomyces mirabilis]|uniref:Uncharacterized protein n=1 Tax=Recurvomyces mirabilis TaxID=574656 RepID=A0AAE0TRV7_9PEZI|nr:hypothetical protein LTR78_007690 [Recurvomyces mirabilis]KAK5151577.1 hypothetical protein LTS14_009064 [Recurvomyces mirabilis]